MFVEIPQGLVISFDGNVQRTQIEIHGTYNTFVNCGSQYAIWHQFPSAIRYAIKDIDSGEIYMSINNELSISPSGNQIYEAYSKKECGKVVSESFSMILSDIYFVSPPKTPIKNLEISCSYYNTRSNAVKILNTSLLLKSF